MKQRLYIETTIVSYLTGRATRDLVIAAHQEETRALWPRLLNPFKRMLIRQVVENEGYRCPEICSPDELMEATP